MSEYSIQIFGNAERCRTEAEISIVSQHEDNSLCAVVFETTSGWEIEIFDDVLIEELGDGFDSAVEDAKRHLRRYVNRRGENRPDGLTVAGLSFWLMEKDDGTVMGSRIKK